MRIERGGTLVRRIGIISLCVVLILSTLFFVHIPKVSASPDEWTEWSYDDFNDSFESGFNQSVKLNGEPGGDGNITLAKKLEWYDMAPASSPGERDGFGFAFESKNNVAVLFGGFVTSEGVKNDTWKYDYETNAWTEIIADGTPDSPPPRDSCRMDYDSANNVIVLWGGVDGLGFLLEDTWEYDVDSKTWTQILVKPSPPSMAGYSLAYDSKYSRILMTGSNDTPPAGFLHLWAFDAATDTWTERNSSDYPRGGHDMAFNGDVMVVQGGAWGLMGEIQYNDTLIYDYGLDEWTWYDYTHAGQNVSRPGFRTGNAMSRYHGGVYDHGGYRTLVYLHTCLNLTRISYYGWVDETPLMGMPKPSARRRHGLVWDSYHNVLILYGGYSESGRLNDTWAYFSALAAEGWYVSKWNGEFYFDSVSVTTSWLRIWWNETSQPAGTKLKFQLQSANVSDPKLPDPDRTLFVGPGNSMITYYETPGEAITDEHRWHRYIRYKAYFEGKPSQSPVLEDITIIFDKTGPPFIVKTDPVPGKKNVGIWKNITVEFNEPMNTSTLTWTISPDPSPGSWIEDWTIGNTTLTLKHPNPFDDSTKYTVTITGCKDLDGEDLIDPYHWNPWDFTTLAVKPWLKWTNPYDGETDIELSRNIIVHFSEPMDNDTVTWLVTPNSPPHPTLGDYTVEWNNTKTTLYLNHTTPYVECQEYSAGITGGLDLKGNPLNSSKGVPNPWTFTTFCNEPYVLDREPELGTLDVSLDRNIIITFSEEMNTSTVVWYVDTNKGGPGLDLDWGWVWESGNTILNISHLIPFDENTTYWVNVTDGEDLTGNPLKRDTGIPRWWFRTEFIEPWINTTNPYDGESGVPTNMSITVTFSEPMKNSTLVWFITPDPGGWAPPIWADFDTKLTLEHSVPFSSGTIYVVNITHCEDLDGNPLDTTKGAPNPWNFTTRVDPPENLRIERNPPDIIIRWDPVQGADEYRVYESQDKFAPWPWSLLSTTYPPATQFTHADAHDDGMTHYYIVRAYKGEESVNSTMGTKVHLTFKMPSSPQLTDINWLSLPFNRIYKKASDISAELNHTKIRTIGKWDASRQKAVTYTYVKGKWKGKDFDINPGDGIFIAGLQQDFYWVVNGTDSEIILDFNHYPQHKKNINWISLPYTGIYNNASSVIIDIEGRLLSYPIKIIEIGKWNASTQTAESFYWDGASWTGKDFIVTAGDGIYLRIIADFNWSIELLTPTVP